MDHAEHDNGQLDDCGFRQDIDRGQVVGCSLYDKTVTLGYCRICLANGKPARGLGDTVAKAIRTATMGKVKKCGGCGRRQAALNRLVPYGDVR